MMPLMSMLSLALAPAPARAQERTSCCADDGCVADVTQARCAALGGAWARCDDRTCEVVGPDGRRSVTDTEHAFLIGAWGYWFGAHRDDGTVPLDPFDPQLVDPCNAWALLMDHDPSVCDAHLPPVSPPGGSGGDTCPDHDEIECGWCTVEYASCVLKAGALGPILGAGYYALFCHPQWKACLEEKCGLDC